MKVPINNCGQHGIISDLPAEQIPLNAFTSGLNVEFSMGVVKKAKGTFGVLGTPVIEPYFLLPVSTLSSEYLLYAGAAKVYVVDAAAVHTNITRQSGGLDVNFTAAVDSRWTGSSLGGLPVINSPTDGPYAWDTVLANKLSSLPYVDGASTWDSTQYSCASMRAFKQFLVAVDITTASDRFPHVVKWSHPAVAGELPESWDETDPTKDAGEYSLSETSGFCVDTLAMRDINIIYKQDSIWGMQLIGGINIFRFYKIFGELGLMAVNCAVEYQSGKHAIFGTGDIAIHDGISMQSLINNKVRTFIFSRIDGTSVSTCFIARNIRNREVWFCYPTTGSNVPNEAFVWNWENNSTSFRELDSIKHAANSRVFGDPVDDTWDSAVGTWATDLTPWGGQGASAAEPSLLLAGTLIYSVLGTTFNGTNFTSYIERTGLGLPPKESGEMPDLSSRKFLAAVYPNIQGALGSVIKVYIGYQWGIGDAMVWEGPYDYTLGITTKITVRLSGINFGVKFSSEEDFEWAMPGYELDVKSAGKR